MRSEKSRRPNTVDQTELLSDRGAHRAELERRRASALDRLGQCLDFGGERTQFGGKRPRIGFAHSGGGIDQRFQQHRQTRQDRLFDSLEGFVKDGLG